MILFNPFNSQHDRESAKRIVDAYLILGISVAHEMHSSDELELYTGWSREKVQMALDILNNSGIIRRIEDREIN